MTPEAPYDFKPLEDYFKRINRWHELTREEFNEIYYSTGCVATAMQMVIDQLKEKNQ